jgi:tRNA(fMet)-specific endonuclease VapC
MRYLLDTNAVISVLNTPDSPLTRRLREHHPREVCISAIVSHELYYGAFKSALQAPNVDLVDRLQFEVLPFDKEDSRKAGEIRAMLVAQGAPIGPYDVLIAGQALAHDLILVTNNLREFTRIPGLNVEDWS